MLHLTTVLVVSFPKLAVTIHIPISLSNSSNMRRQRAPFKPSPNDIVIAALHKRMAQKLIAQPDLFAKVENTLKSRYEAGMLRHGAYLNWECVLALKSDPEAFMEALLDDSPTMLKLRRRTILTGILTEEERTQVLAAVTTSTGNIMQT